MEFGSQPEGFDPNAIAELEPDAWAENLGTFSHSVNPETVRPDDATNAFLALQHGVESGNASPEDIATLEVYVNDLFRPYGLKLTPEGEE
jgi:hypothetical protein